MSEFFHHLKKRILLYKALNVSNTKKEHRPWINIIKGVNKTYISESVILVRTTSHSSLSSAVDEEQSTVAISFNLDWRLLNRLRSVSTSFFASSNSSLVEFPNSVCWCWPLSTSKLDERLSLSWLVLVESKSNIYEIIITL